MTRRTIDMHGQSPSEGVLRLEIPLDNDQATYHVVVHITQEDERACERDANGWPVGFFDRTAGKWQGTIERAPQGDYEQREHL